MQININAKNISFSNLQLLKKFEDEVCETIKDLLNNKYRQINVKLNMSLQEWDGNPIRVKHNASIAIELSNDLVNDINRYLSSRDDIGEVLNERYSIMAQPTNPVGEVLAH